MGTTRIKLEDSIMDIVGKLSESNPGAASVCMQILTEGNGIDPDAAFGSFAHLLDFDSHGIYGERIWMLYKDVCKENLVYTLAVLRAVQLGKLPERDMHHAIDNYGEGIDVKEILLTVQEQLPNFAKDVE